MITRFGLKGVRSQIHVGAFFRSRLQYAVAVRLLHRPVNVSLQEEEVYEWRGFNVGGANSLRNSITCVLAIVITWIRIHNEVFDLVR